MAVKLVPLVALDQHKQAFVSVIGVVVEYSIPRKCKGTDMIMSLRIIDPAMKEVTVNVFMPRGLDFPVFRTPEDVVFLYKFHVRVYDEEPYLMFRKTQSCYWVCSGSNIGFFGHHRHIGPPSVPTSVNTAIDQLRKWRQSTIIAAPTAYEVVSIKDLINNTYPDLVCKVLHICPGGGKNMFLYIWDGTDAPSQIVNPIVADGHCTKTLALNTDFDQLPNAVISLFPEAGTILKVAVDVDDDNLIQHFHFEDRWIKVRNICYQSINGLWKALSTNLKIRLLERSDSIVLDRASNYSHRVNDKKCMPMSYDPLASQVTEIISSKSDCEVSTLLRIRASPVGMMFKCIIRLVQFGISEDGMNFQAVIEDPTTRVLARIRPTEGVHLFSGIQSDEEFEYKFKKLIGYPENCDTCDSLSPPWIPCIITTTLGNPNEPDENRMYHIVFTKLA